MDYKIYILLVVLGSIFVFNLINIRRRKKGKKSRKFMDRDSR